MPPTVSSLSFYNRTLFCCQYVSVSHVAQHRSYDGKWSLSRTDMWSQKDGEGTQRCPKPQSNRSVAVSQSPTITAFWKQTWMLHRMIIQLKSLANQQWSVAFHMFQYRCFIQLFGWAVTEKYWWYCCERDRACNDVVPDYSWLLQ